MINDSLKFIKMYKGLNKNLDFAIDYLLNNNLNSLGIGKLVLNENVYLSKQEYIGKEKKDAKLESHKLYADIQIILENKEYCEFETSSNEENSYINVPYNKEKDVRFYDKEVKNKVLMTPGDFTIFFPGELHRPGIKVNNDLIKKVVLKVKIY